MDITTPATAVIISLLSVSQRNVCRDSLAIVDNPLNTKKTYIVFEATAGNNNLHIDTGATSTYYITKGNGELRTEYLNDAGGTKVLNYPIAGRYVIIIEGDFNGIMLTQSLGGVTQIERDKYLEIYCGTNYPTTPGEGSFYSAKNLTTYIHNEATEIGDSSFFDCSSLRNFSAPLITIIPNTCFTNCVSLQSLIARDVTAIGYRSFDGCSSLASLSVPNAEVIGEQAFQATISLQYFNTNNINSIGDYAFNGSAISGRLTFENNVIIGENAFKDTKNISSVIFNGTATISDKGFDSSALDKVVFKAKSTLGSNVFNVCEFLDYLRYSFNLGTDIDWQADTFDTVKLSQLCGTNGVGNSTVIEDLFTNNGGSLRSGHNTYLD